MVSHEASLSSPKRTKSFPDTVNECFLSGWEGVQQMAVLPAGALGGELVRSGEMIVRYWDVAGKYRD